MNWQCRSSVRPCLVCSELALALTSASSSRRLKRRNCPVMSATARHSFESEICQLDPQQSLRKRPSFRYSRAQIEVFRLPSIERLSVQLPLRTPVQLWKTGFCLVDSSPIRKKLCSILIDLLLGKWPVGLASWENDVNNPMTHSARLRI